LNEKRIGGIIRGGKMKQFSFSILILVGIFLSGCGKLNNNGTPTNGPNETMQDGYMKDGNCLSS
jgi:hypothetical protein